MKKIKSILLFSFSLFFTFHFSFLAFYCFSQGVGINTTGSAAKDAAILEIGEGSDTQGLLIPRVNLTDVDVYLPLTGTSVTSLIVYSSTSPTNGNGPGYYYWSGSKWINIAAPSNGPGTSGQVLTSGGTGAATTWATPATYSAGTGLSLSLNTINSVWTTSGNDIYNNNSANVGIGATSQGAKLDVNGTAKVRTVLGVGADPWDIAGINVSNTGYGAFLTSGSDKQIGLGRQGSGVTWGIGQNTSGLLSIGISGGGAYTEIMSYSSGGNVGIGLTSGINSKLTVAGTVESTGIKLTTSPSAGNVLTSDASGNGTWAAPVSSSKFGGTGADGALTVSSGNTNIDLGGAQTFIKNYSSVSITGTGSITFTNPHTNGTTIIIKSSGNVTLTSSATPMLNASGCGGAGGAGFADPNSVGHSSDNPGATGNKGSNFTVYKSNPGVCSTSAANASTGGSIASFDALKFTSSLVGKYPNIVPGAGGAAGGDYGANNFYGNFTCGSGGAGGGALIIECSGSWNFTTANGISVAGKVGTNGAANRTSGSGIEAAGGGGGGGGGVLLALYNSLIANSGTVTVAGGTGGNLGESPTGQINGIGGGGGGSIINAGTAGARSINSGTKIGGDGGAGTSLIQLNTEF